MPKKHRVHRFSSLDFMEIFDVFFPVFLIVVFFFMSFTLCIGSNQHSINVPDNLGNFPKNITPLSGKKGEENTFSFVVMADTKGGGEINRYTITEQVLSTNVNKRWSFDYCIHRRFLPFFRKIYVSLPFNS